MNTNRSAQSSRHNIECLDSVEALIGNTPLLKIHYRHKGIQRFICVKAEQYNLTGSIKDRMALHILREGYRNGTLHPGDHIIEATSGNCGISLAALGRMLGHPVTIIMPDWMSRERMQLIESYGAKVVTVSREDGGFVGSIARCRQMHASMQDIFLPCQFDNPHNVEAHYHSTAVEIICQMEGHRLRPDIFVAGVGTGGTIMGISKRLRDHYGSISTHPLEPSDSPTLSTGVKSGQHRIQGISDEFIPSIVNLKALDSVVSIASGDAIIMAQMLARELGLGVGISSGANFLGAVKLQSESQDKNHTAVTIFPDDNKKYLSTDYGRAEPVRAEYLTSSIELLGVEALR